MSIQKSLVCVSVACALMGGIIGSASAATVYDKDGTNLDIFGHINGLQYFSGDQNLRGNQSWVRLGMQGRTQLNDQIGGYGKIEYQFNGHRKENATDSDGFMRYAYAGVDFGNAGRFDFGRNDGIIYTAGAYTDKAYEFGNNSITNTDTMQTGRSAGILNYTTDNLFGAVDGLQLKAQYLTSDEGPKWNGTDTPTPNALQEQHGAGYGFGVNYTDVLGSGIGAAAAVSTVKLSDVQQQFIRQTSGASKDTSNAWIGALKYDKNNIYLATMYGETTNAIGVNTSIGSQNIIPGLADKTKNFEAIAQIQATDWFRPSVGYVQSRASFTENGLSTSQYIQKYYTVGAKFNVTKNAYAYVEYKFNRIPANNPLGLSHDDQMAVSLNYEF